MLLVNDLWRGRHMCGYPVGIRAATADHLDELRFIVQEVTN